MNNTYDESSIKILEGLDAVRKRPGMYIGSTDKRGLHHLIWEVVDNAVDEIINGFGNEITVTMHKDGSLSVSDNGRGVPTGMHASGITTPEVIFTILHAGGKFESSGYKVSGGLHGVGASVVNALSTDLEVIIYKDKKIHNIKFNNGGNLISPLTVVGTTNKTGTTVRFTPDPAIFSTTKFSFSTICERMQESAFLIKNLRINIINEIDENSESYYYEKGIESFIEYLNEDKKTIHNVFSYNDYKNDIEVEVALQYTTTYNDNIISFVNNVKTIDGGTHETGFKAALTRVLNEYARNNNILKAKDTNFDGNDTREGITAIISLKIPEGLLQFEGQTKSKLGTPIAKSIVEAITYEKIKYFLEENKEIASNILDKVVKSKLAREAARKAKDDLRNGKSKNKREKLLGGKLSPAGSKNKKINELFIVEGDSAGGSAKSGRDSKFQAILPLRGKVLNAEKCKMEDLFKNEEINTLIYAIGAYVGSGFDINECNYDKVIIMTDADNDGAHIQILLLTFFYRHMKPLIEAGKLYVALSPLFEVEYKKETLYFYNEEELSEFTKDKSNSNYKISRNKGLGEVEANVLWDTTMNPETRQIIRVSIKDAALAEKRVSVLMGDNVEPRKKWIDENVEFSLEDNYEI